MNLLIFSNSSRWHKFLLFGSLILILNAQRRTLILNLFKNRVRIGTSSVQNESFRCSWNNFDTNFIREIKVNFWQNKSNCEYVLTVWRVYQMLQVRKYFLLYYRRSANEVFPIPKIWGGAHPDKFLLKPSSSNFYWVFLSFQSSHFLQ